MTRNQFAQAFINFINANFKPGTTVTTSMIKDKLKNNKKLPIHKQYDQFLEHNYGPHNRSWHWKLQAFDRVANWMKYHPNYQRVPNGTYTLLRSQPHYKVQKHINRIQL